MESNNDNKGVIKKTTLIVYLDLHRNSYRYFVELPSVTAGELVDKILHKYVEHGYVPAKSNDYRGRKDSTPLSVALNSPAEFSLYLINSKLIDMHIHQSKNKTVPITEEEGTLEDTIDSADKFPKVWKRKLTCRDKPAEIIERATKRMKNKNPTTYQWDLYFLVNSSRHSMHTNPVSAPVNKEGAIFDQLKATITDK